MSHHFCPYTRRFSVGEYSPPFPLQFVAHCPACVSNAKDTNTFSLCVCVQPVSPSRQCNYALPSHPTLLFSFRAQRASATLAFRNAKDTNTFSLCVCVQGVSPSRQCNYALPPHPTLLFSFRAQRASAMKLLTFLVRMCIVVTCGPSTTSFDRDDST